VNINTHPGSAVAAHVFFNEHHKGKLRTNVSRYASCPEMAITNRNYIHRSFDGNNKFRKHCFVIKLGK
jgi:hypothetical protein